MGMQVVFEYYKRRDNWCSPLGYTLFLFFFTTQMLVGVALAIRQPAHRWQSLSNSLRTLHEGFSSLQHTSSSPVDDTSSSDNDDHSNIQESAEDDNISYMKMTYIVFGWCLALIQQEMAVVVHILM